MFEIKSEDKEESWKALINLCKVLIKLPDKLEEALKPILDIDSVLWFLAVDVALINCDGYWIRSERLLPLPRRKGKFHVIPSDMNECFRPAGGPGFGPGAGMFIRMAPPGELLPPPIQEMLQLSEAQRKQLGVLQKEIDGKLEKLLTEDQRKQLKEMHDRGPGGLGPPGPGGPGGFGPPGGGPGGFPGGFGPPGGGFGPPGGMGGAAAGLISIR